MVRSQFRTLGCAAVLVHKDGEFQGKVFACGYGPGKVPDLEMAYEPADELDLAVADAMLDDPEYEEDEDEERLDDGKDYDEYNSEEDYYDHEMCQPIKFNHR